MTYTNLPPFVKRLIWAVGVLAVVVFLAAITRFTLLLFLAPAFAWWTLFPPTDEDIKRTSSENDKILSGAIVSEEGSDWIIDHNGDLKYDPGRWEPNGNRLP